MRVHSVPLSSFHPSLDIWIVVDGIRSDFVALAITLPLVIFAQEPHPFATASIHTILANHSHSIPHSTFPCIVDFAVKSTPFQYCLVHYLRLHGHSTFTKQRFVYTECLVHLRIEVGILDDLLSRPHAHLVQDIVSEVAYLRHLQ